MLLKPRSDDYMANHPTPEDVFLLIEVADSTLDYDRRDKLPAYGRTGIAEVWIINLPELTIEVHREPHFAGYKSRTVIRGDDAASVQAFPDVSIQAGILLRKAV